MIQKMGEYMRRLDSRKNKLLVVEEVLDDFLLETIRIAKETSSGTLRSIFTELDTKWREFAKIAGDFAVESEDGKVVISRVDVEAYKKLIKERFNFYI